MFPVAGSHMCVSCPCFPSIFPTQTDLDKALVPERVLLLDVRRLRKQPSMASGLPQLRMACVHTEDGAPPPGGLETRTVVAETKGMSTAAASCSRTAVATVSPHTSYETGPVPSTPATTEPVCSPIRTPDTVPGLRASSRRSSRTWKTPASPL